MKAGDYFPITVLIFHLLGGRCLHTLYFFSPEFLYDDVSCFGGLIYAELRFLELCYTRCSELVIVMRSHSRMNDVVLDLL